LDHMKSGLIPRQIAKSRKKSALGHKIGIWKIRRYIVRTLHLCRASPSSNSVSWISNVSGGAMPVRRNLQLRSSSTSPHLPTTSFSITSSTVMMRFSPSRCWLSAYVASVKLAQLRAPLASLSNFFILKGS